jgi:superoxide dismutase, Fe-Mn family
MFSLAKLPYAYNALAPHISAETLKLHHGKHHKIYVDKLNELLTEDPMADCRLEEMISKSHGDTKKLTIFNNAAQCWNHDFLWNSMSPDGGGLATGAIKRMIDAAFDHADAFNNAFVAAAVGHFGSGWAWLVLNDDKLEITTTHDADLPLVHGQTALLTCDLWEHAYYVDYQNRRPDYVKVFLAHLINWDFANANLAAVQTSESV